MQLTTYPISELKYDGYVMILIEPKNTQGDFRVVEYGKGFVPSQTGLTLVIEEKYIDQLGKFRVEMNNMFQPILRLKENEELEEAEESYDVVRARDLQRELDKIREEQYRIEAGLSQE